MRVMCVNATKAQVVVLQVGRKANWSNIIFGQGRSYQIHSCETRQSNTV